MNPVLQVKQVEKYFGRANNLTRALNQISFEVQPGEFVAIMGASGSGKTTLLNCIATIDQVSSGQIIVANQDITKLKGKSRLFIREIYKKWIIYWLKNKCIVEVSEI